jgi:hypothetical protein
MSSAHCHFLNYFLIVKDDNDESGNSLSSLGFFCPVLFIYFVLSCYKQRRHVSCPRFNVIINKLSIIKINLK